MRNTLAVEWENVEIGDIDQRLLRVFEILFSKEYQYEEKNKDTE